VEVALETVKVFLLLPLFSHRYLHKFLTGVETIKKHGRGVLHTPNIESPIL